MIPVNAPFIRVALLSPTAAPQIGIIPNTLEARQKMVGGLIQLFWPDYTTNPELEGTVLICNEDGLFVGGPLNHDARKFGLTIFGNVLVCNEIELDDDTPFVDLSDLAIEWMQCHFNTVKATDQLLPVPAESGY